MEQVILIHPPSKEFHTVPPDASPLEILEQFLNLLLRATFPVKQEADGRGQESLALTQPLVNPNDPLGILMIFDQVAWVVNCDDRRSEQSAPQDRSQNHREALALGIAFHPDDRKLAATELEKAKKARSRLQTISELGRCESVKSSEQKLTEHEASFGFCFCFYGGDSRPREILPRVKRAAIEHIV